MLFRSIVYCAPIYPFTGFSYPFESMGASAALFGEALPLTHLIRAQGALLFMQEPTPVFARAVVAMAFFGVLFAALAHLGTLFWGRFKRP